MSNNSYDSLEELENNRKSFLNRIRIEQDKDKQRILVLKRKYDEGEISESDISEEDAKKILELYEEEIARIKDDTNKAKNRIRRMLNELKNS